VGEEDAMLKLESRIADFSFRDCRNTVLIRPDLNIACDSNRSVKERFLWLGKNSFDHAYFDDVLERILSFGGIVHHGNLRLDSGDLVKGELCRFEPCGGLMDVIGRRPVLICAACGIRMFLDDMNYDFFNRAIFFLLKKQMFPEIRTCNCIDCGKLAPEIKEIGLISLLRGVLRGSMKNIKTDEFDLGFTLMPGIDTAAGEFNGFDAWTRYLIWKEAEFLRLYLDGSYWKFLGPKSLG
jgi:hypothetical protein